MLDYFQFILHNLYSHRFGRYIECILNYFQFILQFGQCHVQVHLATDKLGQSVDECDALLKKHEAFERLITSQEEKVCKLFHLYSETPW